MNIFNMNGTRIIKWMLVLLVFCTVSMSNYNACVAECIVPDAEESTLQYNEFIVGISESDAKMFQDDNLEFVSEGVYLTDSYAEVNKIIQSGKASYVEPNYVASLFSDEQLSDSWHFDAVEASFAHEYDLKGKGVKVAIIDSGIDIENADLRDANISTGYDYINESVQSGDPLYHGTKVAQIIAADNNEIGITGIAEETEIIPLRCFSDSGSATIAVLSRAIIDAVDVYHCDVINMSWGIKTNSQTLYEAIKYANSKGVVLVAAIGNVSSKYPQGTVVYPAAYPEVISVSSMDSDYKIASTSLRNGSATVCAPGADISFTDKNGNIVKDSGTSFACPCITAEIAILMQLAPFVNPEDVMELLKTRAKPIGNLDYDDGYGYGFLKLDSLIDTPWSKISSNDGQLLAAGWNLDNRGMYIAMTAYNAEGRMLISEIEKIESNNYYEQIEMQLPDSWEVLRLFNFDMKYTPLCMPVDLIK